MIGFILTSCVYFYGPCKVAHGDALPLVVIDAVSKLDGMLQTGIGGHAGGLQKAAVGMARYWDRDTEGQVHCSNGLHSRDAPDAARRARRHHMPCRR